MLGTCAEEPLALCALGGLAGPTTSVVLAGDPKQLGPVIHSSVAKQAGLGVSLLERLTSLPPYAAVVDGGSGASSGDGLIVKLVRNYRSHHSLLRLPSQLFYGGEPHPSCSAGASSSQVEVGQCSLLR